MSSINREVDPPVNNGNHGDNWSRPIGRVRRQRVMTSGERADQTAVFDDAGKADLHAGNVADIAYAAPSHQHVGLGSALWSA
jgi:hypothetical protein